MSSRKSPRSLVADVVYGFLNPIPFGFFVAALIFDIIYFRSGEVLWNKGAAWLLTFGLLFAIVPRVVNLVQIWLTSRQLATRTHLLDFWLNLIAIATAILNAFVHSRDAYATMPTGVWLSVCTVVLLSIGRILVAVQSSAFGGYVHD